MTKRIDDLSSEELGKLFPIEVVPYDPAWPQLFNKERELLIQTLGLDNAIRVEHFGSTSVPGLSAKPTIDILLGISVLTEELKAAIRSKMESIGYAFIWRTDDRVPYMMFVKGYTLEGIKGQSYHIHAAEPGHTLWDRLYFRDHLRNNSSDRNAYENLKLELAMKYKYDREAYTEGKSEFIKRITERSKVIPG